MKKTTLLSLFLGLLLLTSCGKQPSNSVDQDKIHTHYEVFYNSNTDKTIAIARFRFGGPAGTLLELEGNSYCTYNGDPMNYNVTYSGHTVEYDGLNFGGAFEYENNAGDVFTNNAISFDSIAFPTSFDSLYKSTDYDLDWDGSVLVANENVGLFIGSLGEWGQDALLLQTTQGVNNITITTNSMNNLATGTSTCYMDRTHVQNSVNGSSTGGKITSKYRASNQNIQVVD